jgi:hypothetical protein
MARFYGTVSGRRGDLKTATDPEYVDLNGWDAGVTVRAAVVGDKKDNRDAFEVFMNYGSNAHGNPVKIGTVYQTPAGPQFEPAEDVA